MSFEVWLAAVLAVWQVVEVLHHAKITMPIREWAVAIAGCGGLRGFVAAVLLCPFCLSHWVGAFIVCWVLLDFWLLPVWILATIRGANVLHDLLGGRSRTPENPIIEYENLSP